MVQQLRLHISTAGHLGFIPDQGKKIPHGAVKKKKKIASLAHEFQELMLQNHETSFRESSEEEQLFWSSLLLPGNHKQLLFVWDWFFFSL